jgi:hypothetical protein
MKSIDSSVDPDAWAISSVAAISVATPARLNSDFVVRIIGQAGLAVGTAGMAGTSAYNGGAAVVKLACIGLMGEFTVSGARFSYQPVDTK